MAVRTKSAALLGIDAVGVDVETQIISSLKRFVIVGLPDGVLREARERVRCAIENSGFTFPHREVVVSLAPAALPKAGSGFDLAIALGILAADGQLDGRLLRGLILLGELALDGSIKAVPGALAASVFARKIGGHRLVVSPESSGIAALIEGVEVTGVNTLLELVGMLTEQLVLPAVSPPRLAGAPFNGPGFGDVVGQTAAKRAIEVAAAGGHNLFFIGPPGAGKSMLARRMPSIMPVMARDDVLEVTRIYSALRATETQGAAGRGEVMFSRPFRAPHHTISTAGLIGGGSIPAPGEVSLAHRGVLFLDELLEMRRDTVEALREPLESKYVAICRAKMKIRFPADFIFVAAANPCPCGKRGLNGAGPDLPACQCPPAMLHRYSSRLSGPITDRLDLTVWVPAVPVTEFHLPQAIADPTEEMRQRVADARRAQAERYQTGAKLNSQIGTKELREFCRLDAASIRLLESAAARFHFSARSYTKVLKVSRTIADLELSPAITATHMAEALSYRLRLNG